jgi:RimJ/RimL family protein N-acetyltransferase
MLVIRAAQFRTLERQMRHRLAVSVLDGIRASAPHAVNGLSAAEVDARIEVAVGKAERYCLDVPEDVKAFIRLCLVVGPNFDAYPRFQEILTAADPRTGLAMMELFYLAGEEDWVKAAQFDIVSRYRQPILDTPISQERRQAPCGQVSLTPLQSRHAEPYFSHALHPDVWRLARMKPLTAIEEVQQLILEKEGYAILTDRDEFCGAIFVSRVETARRISYWIGRSLWGIGMATQALKEMTRILRRESGAPISLRIDSANIPSMNVAEKCGFKRTNPSAGAELILEV